MKLKGLFRIYSISIGIAILLAGVYYLLRETVPQFPKGENFRKGFLIGIMITSIAISLFYELKYKSFSYKPYNIAIIGFPRSGKTTLIATLFQQIFKQKVSGLKATLKGESTIERINELIEKKESGLPVGPTNDQTMFAYRTEIEIGNSPLTKEFYRVEFGDYPGEESAKLADNSYFDNLKKTEFFKWCFEANAYIFIIDVAKLALAIDDDKPNAYIASVSKAIRQSWQHFVDYNLNRSGIKKKPVLLIFNKMDVCNLSHDKIDDDKWINEVHRIAYSFDEVPNVDELDKDAYQKVQKILLKEFADIISYLESEINQFNILYTSSFGTIDGNFPDVEKILKLIFPKKTIL